MTFKDAYELASEWIANVAVDAWLLDPANVSEGVPVEAPAGGYAIYQLSSAGIENDTPVSDVVTMSWTLAGVFENLPGTGRELLKAENASAAHALASNPVAGLFMPQVQDINFEDLFENDLVTVTLTITCMAVIDR
jgi:hypothetical protein